MVFFCFVSIFRLCECVCVYYRSTPRTDVWFDFRCHYFYWIFFIVSMDGLSARGEKSEIVKWKSSPGFYERYNNIYIFLHVPHIAHINLMSGYYMTSESRLSGHIFLMWCVHHLWLTFKKCWLDAGWCGERLYYVTPSNCSYVFISSVCSLKLYLYIQPLRWTNVANDNNWHWWQTQTSFSLLFTIELFRFKVIYIWYFVARFQHLTSLNAPV